MRHFAYRGRRSPERRVAMRVGILLGQTEPTAGAGHTFQREVFETFLTVGAKSRHSYVLFCHAGTASKLPRNPLPNTEVAVLDSEASPARSRLFGRGIPPLKSRSLDEQVKAAQVDFVWQVSAPGQVLETPYMVVVWDLQHRLQPWFPEVSADGNWQHREGLYGSVLRRAAAIIVGTRAGGKEVERFYQIDPSRILILPHPTPRFASIANESTECISARYGLSGDYLLYPAQ